MTTTKIETPFICPQCGKDTTVDDFCSKRCEREFVAEEAAWAKTMLDDDALDKLANPS